MGKKTVLIAAVEAKFNSGDKISSRTSGCGAARF